MPERKVYRFRVDPTARQAAALTRFAGARSFVFNWALARRKETYEQSGKSISWSALSVELTELKNKSGFEWLKEIVSQLLQQALSDCKRAFENFFQKRARFPKFKREHGEGQSFRIPQRVKLDRGRLYIPKIGRVAVRQSEPCDLPLRSATFKREATGKWDVSLVAEFDLPDSPEPAIESETAIGIEIGFDRFGANSNGGVVENPRFFRKVGCNFPLMYYYVACSITFAQKLSHCCESLIARSCKIGAPDSRFQRIPLRQNRDLMSSLQPASVTPLPMGKPAARNSA